MIEIILFSKLGFRLATHFQFYHYNSFITKWWGSLKLESYCFRNMLMILKWNCLKFVFFRILRSLQIKAKAHDSNK